MEHLNYEEQYTLKLMKRILNIAKGMLIDGKEYYSTHAPRITADEFYLLEKLGFRIQCEFPHPPESKFFYMMPEFEKYNIKLYNNMKKEFDELKKEYRKK